MEAPSPARTRLSEHLSKFAYDSGKKSPLKLEPKDRLDRADQAVKIEAIEQSLQPTGQPITPSPRRLAKISNATPSTVSPLSIPDRKARRGCQSDGQDSPLSDLSDMSDSTDRLSKRRRATKDADSKPKNEKVPRGYADPSVYAHLDLLPDQLREGLDGKCNSQCLAFTK
jgi:hypothetical protein